MIPHNSLSFALVLALAFTFALSLSFLLLLTLLLSLMLLLSLLLSLTLSSCSCFRSLSLSLSLSLPLSPSLPLSDYNSHVRCTRLGFVCYLALFVVLGLADFCNLLLLETKKNCIPHRISVRWSFLDWFRPGILEASFAGWEWKQLSRNLPYNLPVGSNPNRFYVLNFNFESIARRKARFVAINSEELFVQMSVGIFFISNSNPSKQRQKVERSGFCNFLGGVNYVPGRLKKNHDTHFSSKTSSLNKKIQLDDWHFFVETEMSKV